MGGDEQRPQDVPLSPAAERAIEVIVTVFMAGVVLCLLVLLAAATVAGARYLLRL